MAMVLDAVEGGLEGRGPRWTEPSNLAGGGGRVNGRTFGSGLGPPAYRGMDRPADNRRGDRGRREVGSMTPG